ncbi:uncharacterized protein LOC141720448 isoform X1 [Apium graveolens]|uniref:uncharacterized protein LOC141720448 isoform X1 n=1 Tax=Apium graveolens TaxID=4045 RepID=UPI003D78BC53
MPKSSLCQGMNVQGNDKGISLLRSRNKFFQILIQVNTRSDPDVKDASIDRDTDLLIFANDRLWKELTSRLCFFQTDSALPAWQISSQDPVELHQFSYVLLETENMHVGTH